MLKNMREREIINILKKKNGFISVKELCTELFASESSIRRDLCVLENRGVIKRTYGGAELNKNASNVLAFSHRTHHNAEKKIKIAKKASKLISDGNIIFLDQSSTSYYLAKEISDKKEITVITNNIEIISFLSVTKIHTISSGGFLSQNNRMCLIGADAQQIFENSYADFMFFSSQALSDDGIISDCTREEVVIRNSMLKNSNKKVFLCDSEKFSSKSAYKQCSLLDIDFLISENDDARKQFKHFSNLTIM